MTPDEAKDLAALLGGPGVVGVAVLFGYARRVLAEPTRESLAGWRVLGVGAVLFAWLVIFLGLSTQGVLHSWTADGNVESSYVALSAAWLLGIALLGTVILHSRRVAEYLSESYRHGEWPVLVRWMRAVFRL